jgi:hypothetical protein
MGKYWTGLVAIATFFLGSAFAQDSNQDRIIIIDRERAEQDRRFRIEDLREHEVNPRSFTPQQQRAIRDKIRNSTRPQTNERG